MIGRLRGELLETSAGMALVDCGGVGYEVSVPESVMVQMPGVGSRVDLYIRQIFREDGVSLYGFLSQFERRVFDLLLEVKGCGPRVGLALLGQLGADTVAAAVVGSDARTLSKASGVGQRLADRIILEIKPKMEEEVGTRKISAGITISTKQEDDELVGALLVLGFKKSEADWAAGQVDPELPIQDRVKQATHLMRKG